MKTQEDFEQADRLWRSSLTGRSLVIEANADVSEATEALAVLGRTFGSQASEAKRIQLLREYPAAFLVGTCAVAAVTYDQGTFWPHFERQFGTLSQNDRTLVSVFFREGLERFDLSRFKFPQRNVGEIMMHAGIPGQRTDEFMALLQRRDALANGLDGRQFCQWLGTMSRETAYTYGLDAPTWRFLTEGREIAEDLVDRCLELLDKWATTTVTEADVSMFPSVMRKDLLRALDELAGPVVRTSGSSRKKIELAPRLLFDVSDGVQLRLPSLEHVIEDRVNWAIAAEGSTARLTVDSPWPGDPVVEHRHIVSRPVKQLALTATPSNQTWLVNVIDPDDPMLIFDAETRDWVPARNSLPKADVFVAIPNPEKNDLSTMLEIEGDAAIEAQEAPLGWGLWSFARVSLTGVSKLRLRDTERWRYVSTVTRPQIEPRGVNEWASAQDGSVVCGGLPTVKIPGVVDAEGASSNIVWTITISRASDGETFLERRVISTDVTQTIELDWERIPPLGVFDVKVTGPLGRGTSRRLTIARDLQISPSVTFRPMSALGIGLTEATMDVWHYGGNSLSVTLAPQEAATTMRLAVANDEVSVRCAIPAMSVTALGREERPPSHSPVNLDLEDLTSSALRVRVAAPGRTVLVAMQGGTILQTIESTAFATNCLVTYNIAQLADTLGQSGGATLLVGHDGMRIPIARLRPRQFLHAARLEGDTIVLDGLATTDTLLVAAYRRYAPWLPPFELRTDGSDRIELPAELRGEGELRLMVAIEDPWIPATWPPEYPSLAANTFDLVIGDLEDNRGGDDQGFRSWLCRTAPCPDRTESLPLAISLYAGGALSRYRTPMRELKRELARAISRSAQDVFAAVTVASVEAAPIELFVAADVVSQPPGIYPHGPELWEAAPLLAVLAQNWITASQSDRDDLERVVGASSTSILDAGLDPFAAVGRFGQEIEIMVRWPEDRVDAVWRSVNAVPGRVLDDTTRQIAAKELFDQLKRVQFDVKAMGTATVAALRVLTAEFGERGRAPVDTRTANAGWPSLPAMCLAFALIARAAARGSVSAALLHEVTKPYLEELARSSPKLVAQDLTLAELWITRWSNYDNA